MFNQAGKLIFTSTAIAPVGLTYAWANLRDHRTEAVCGIAISLSLVIVALGFISLARRRFEKVTIHPVSVEASDKENVAFLLLYLSPFFTSNFSSLNWNILLPTFFVFAVVVASGYNYHFNPLLGLLGWHAYRVSDRTGVTYVVFTKRQMRTAIDALQVVQLTEYVLLDTGDR